MRDSEKNLVQRLREGEAHASEQFVRDYGPRIYDLHCWLCGDRTAAEDLTQETVLAVIRDIRKFRGDSRLFTWVHQVARNIAGRYLRQAGHESLPLEEAGDPPAPDDTADLVRQELLRDRVREALGRLPVTQRESVTLHCLSGLSHSEVARALGRPLGTVKWQIAQGLHALRDALLLVGVDPDEL